jgi:hypothetical protein
LWDITVEAIDVVGVVDVVDVVDVVGVVDVVDMVGEVDVAAVAFRVENAREENLKNKVFRIQDSEMGSIIEE